VRAVPPEALGVIAAGLSPEIPLHIHLSEQPAENQACLAATGLTPTGLLHRHGLLSGRLSAVHATHLSDADIELLGGAGTTVVMCPTTEADLADGIGPAGALQRAGARIALGTDQHAVVDPWLRCARSNTANGSPPAGGRSSPRRSCSTAAPRGACPPRAVPGPAWSRGPCAT
jgi:cytosine/adenosine deaminase-related metal-dependent hydrolase